MCFVSGFFLLQRIWTPRRVVDYTCPEDVGRKLLENLFNYVPVDTELYARRCESSSTWL
jgi:hypothetical protein